MHNNMITINGQKMGKSLGNFITLREFFNGEHQELARPYSPMTIRFFILQAHYRSTLDFSNEALQAAEKGLQRLLQAVETLEQLNPADKSTTDIGNLAEKCHAALQDDFNSPVAIAHLFDAVKTINALRDRRETLTGEDLENLRATFRLFLVDIFGLTAEKDEHGQKDELLEDLMELILELRKKARENKDWETADKLRNSLNRMNIIVKDSKEGSTWEINR